MKMSWILHYENCLRHNFHDFHQALPFHSISKLSIHWSEKDRAIASFSSTSPSQVLFGLSLWGIRQVADGKEELRMIWELNIVASWVDHSMNGRTNYPLLRHHGRAKIDWGLLVYYCISSLSRYVLDPSDKIISSIKVLGQIASSMWRLPNFFLTRALTTLPTSICAIVFLYKRNSHCSMYMQ